MMREVYTIRTRGDVKIYSIKENSRELIFEKHNAILTNAKKILVRAAGGQSAYAIDTIEVYKAAGLLASQGTLTIDFPAGDDKMRFVGRFNETSFNDTLDEVRLVSSTGGIFSQITGLSHTKDGTTQIEIEWVITINNL